MTRKKSHNHEDIQKNFLIQYQEKKKNFKRKRKKDGLVCDKEKGMSSFKMCVFLGIKPSERRQAIKIHFWR